MAYYISWWEQSILLRPFDFAVLGAGLIGKQIAIKLKKKYPNARIAIIDRSPISYGASTRNAGFACFGSVSEIIDDFNRSETEQVIALASKRYKGIQQLIKEFGTDAIGYRPSGSYEVFTTRSDRDNAFEAYDRINALLQESNGLKDVFTPFSSDSFHMHVEKDCLYNPYEGMLNSGMLNEVINEKTHTLGVIPLYGLNIQSINKDSNSYTLLSEQGMNIRCNQLIIASNAFSSQFLPSEDISPARGQILLTKPMGDIPFDGIFHSDKGYIYFRTLGDRILLGGGRNKFYDKEKTFDMQGSEELKEYLTMYLQTYVIPGREFEIDMHWSGIMAMGKEKIPIVKRIDENAVACVRMSGMGVALGPVLSDVVMDLL